MTGDSVENDSEARLKLWSAICHAADLLEGSCSVFISKEPEPEGRVKGTSALPNVRTWQLMEALSLLSVLLKAEKVVSEKVYNIFGRSGPFH